jgi:hypothetical protein
VSRTLLNSTVYLAVFFCYAVPCNDLSGEGVWLEACKLTYKPLPKRKHMPCILQQPAGMVLIEFCVGCSERARSTL